MQPSALALALALALISTAACGRKEADAAEAPPAPPSFREPSAGPRAPTARAFGLDLGAATYADVQAHTKRLGLTCKDTSIRALMQEKREAELAKAAERGEDAVSSASWVKKKSKREGNPQIRFSCPDTPAAVIGDRPRPPSTGRFLLVLDSDDLPLRHASYQRTHDDHAAALADFEDAVAAFSATYGPPTGRVGELPRPDEGGKVHFPPAQAFEARWEYADLLIKVTALQFGRQRVTIGERVEVPHGVRPDAPAKPAG